MCHCPLCVEIELPAYVACINICVTVIKTRVTLCVILQVVDDDKSELDDDCVTAI
jgi:hypothetical protein